MKIDGEEMERVIYNFRRNEGDENSPSIKTYGLNYARCSVKRMGEHFKLLGRL